MLKPPAISRTQRVAASVFLLLVAAGGGAAALAARHEHQIDGAPRSYAAPPRLVVSNVRGTVRVVRGAAGTVTVTRSASYSGSEPGFSVARVGNELRVRSSCSSTVPGIDVPFFEPCRVTLTLRVPPAIALRIDSDTGDVELQGLGGVITTRLGTGDIRAADLRASDVTLESGVGDVTARFRSHPQRVNASSGTGDVHLTIPPGTYRIDASTGVGSRSVDGLIDDPRSSSVIHAESGVGDVTVEPSHG